MAELIIELDRGTGKIAEQLINALRAAIRDGRVPAGSDLPASRALAADLGISRGVVVEAYEQLVAEGYLVSRPGSGTKVATVAPSAPAPEAEANGTTSTIEIDLTPGTPDLAEFPRRAWSAALRHVMATLPHSALGYADPGGVLELRTEIAAYLRRVRAAQASPARTIITAGAGQGMALGLRALVARGHRVLAVEDPSGDRSRPLLEAAGVEIVGVPVDGDGIVVAELENTDATIVMVTPAHQYPLGTVLSPERRIALLAWADRVDGIVIEDDYDAEFRYDREPVGCMQGLAPERILYLGTASKALAPGVRLGWALAPDWLTEALRRGRADTDLGSPVLDQLTLARMFESGTYDRHLRATRLRLRQRRDALASALAESLPDWRVRGVAAGAHLVAELPPRLGESQLLAAAAERGVRVQPLSPMRFSPGPPGVVLGYAGLTPAQLTEAARRLAKAAKKAQRR